MVDVRDFGVGAHGLAGALNRALSVDFDGPGKWWTEQPELSVPPGVYDLDEPIAISRGEKNGVVINAHGVVLKNGSSANCLQIGSCSHVQIRGLKLDLKDNDAADQAILFTGSASWTSLIDVGVQANSANPDFAPVRMVQSDPDNRNTGNFWTTFDRFWCRKMSGADANAIGTCIDMQGAQNATTLLNSSFGNFGTGVHVRNQSAASGIANDVKVGFSRFEGGSGSAIKISSTDASDTIQGIDIIGSRFEALNAVLELAGITAQPAQPPMLMGNTVISSVPNYMINPNGLYVNSLDALWVGSGAAPVLNIPDVMRIRGRSGYPILDLEATVAGSLRLYRHGTSIIDGQIAQAAGGGMLLDGGTTQVMRMRHVKGLSGSDVIAKNFSGMSYLGAGNTYVDVQINPESDTNYRVVATGDRNAPVFVTNKTTTGFRLNIGSALSETLAIGWLLVR